MQVAPWGLVILPLLPSNLSLLTWIARKAPLSTCPRQLLRGPGCLNPWQCTSCSWKRGLPSWLLLQQCCCPCWSGQPLRWFQDLAGRRFCLLEKDKQHNLISSVLLTQIPFGFTRASADLNLLGLEQSGRILTDGGKPFFYLYIVFFVIIFHGWGLMRPFFLACRQLLAHCIFT